MRHVSGRFASPGTTHGHLGAKLHTLVRSRRLKGAGMLYTNCCAPYGQSLACKSTTHSSFHLIFNTCSGRPKHPIAMSPLFYLKEPLWVDSHALDRHESLPVKVPRSLQSPSRESWSSDRHRCMSRCGPPDVVAVTRTHTVELCGDVRRRGGSQCGRAAGSQKTKKNHHHTTLKAMGRRARGRAPTRSAWPSAWTWSSPTR